MSDSAIYCRKCYRQLDPTADVTCCFHCDYKFDPADSGTFLRRPFPSYRRMLVHLLITVIISVGVAFIVSAFQMTVAAGTIGGH